MTDDSLRTSVTMAALAGGTVAAWTALPEFIDGRWKRLAARGALLATSSVGVILADDSEPTPHPERDEKFAALSRALEDPVQRTAIWLIALVALSAVSSLEEKALDAAAARFEARGARNPRTSLGLALGAIAAGTQLAPAPRRA